jgi:hypothetical protein
VFRLDDLSVQKWSDNPHQNGVSVLIPPPMSVLARKEYDRVVIHSPSAETLFDLYISLAVQLKISISDNFSGLSPATSPFFLFCRRARAVQQTLMRAPDICQNVLGYAPSAIFG